MVNETRDFGTFPTSGERTPVRTVVIPTSAYNSLPNQTDSTPFIMASGNLVYDGAVASNYWPLGTKIRIPEYSGDRVFIVEDRMNSRYHKRMDIWMEDYDDAVHFGVRGLIVEIF